MHWHQRMSANNPEIPTQGIPAARAKPQYNKLWVSTCIELQISCLVRYERNCVEKRAREQIDAHTCCVGDFRCCGILQSHTTRLKQSKPTRCVINKHHLDCTNARGANERCDTPITLHTTSASMEQSPEIGRQGPNGPGCFPKPCHTPGLPTGVRTHVDTRDVRPPFHQVGLASHQQRNPGNLRAPLGCPVQGPAFKETGRAALCAHCVGAIRPTGVAARVQRPLPGPAPRGVRRQNHRRDAQRRARYVLADGD